MNRTKCNKVNIIQKSLKYKSWKTIQYMCAALYKVSNLKLILYNTYVKMDAKIRIKSIKTFTKQKNTKFMIGITSL